jgi:hypothetical protein
MRTFATLLLAAPLAVAAQPLDDSALHARVARPTAKVAPDLSGLPDAERAALGPLLGACRVMDALYLRQVWGGNEALLQRLVADRTGLGTDRLTWFLWNKGPWSLEDHARPFIAGVPPRPAALTFYPPDATKEEIQRWMATLSSGDRAQAVSPVTVIRRRPDRSLVSVPYSVEYQAELVRAAELLESAAGITREPTLSRLLTRRATAFRTNSYGESDEALVGLTGRIDAVLGPFEPDDDGWFGVKTAFECFVSLVAEAPTARLASLAQQLSTLHARIPVPAGVRGPVPGRAGSIVIVDTVLAAGNGNVGTMVGGYGLPNDREVVSRAGTRTAVFRSALAVRSPGLSELAARTLAPDQPAPSLDDDVLDVALVRLMDALGPEPRGIGAETARSSQLRSMLLELWAIDDLAARGVLPTARTRALDSAFVVLMLDRARQGGSSTARLASMALFQRLVRDGAASVGGDGRIRVDPGRRSATVRTFLGEVFTAQVEGNADYFRRTFSQDGTPGVQLRSVLDRLGNLPGLPRPVYSSTLEP